MTKQLHRDKVQQILKNAAEEISKLLGHGVEVYYSNHKLDISIPDLARVCSETLGIDLLKGVKRRDRDLVAARHIFFWLACKYCRVTVGAIGKYMGYDHTTVIHGREHIRKMIQTNDEYYLTPLHKIEQKLISNEAKANEQPV